MFNLYFSITLQSFQRAHHFTAKHAVECEFHCFLLIYAVALLSPCLDLFLPATNGITAELKQLNWSSIGLAIAIVGIEFGFLLTYRAGWDLGIAAVLVNVVASLILVPVAIFFFKDKISLINILGILVCLAGLVMLNWKR
jgi:multidrug transporter EmrE-like cation transporter